MIICGESSSGSVRWISASRKLATSAKVISFFIFSFSFRPPIARTGKKDLGPVPQKPFRLITLYGGARKTVIRYVPGVSDRRSGDIIKLCFYRAGFETAISAGYFSAKFTCLIGHLFKFRRPRSSARDKVRAKPKQSAGIREAVSLFDQA